MAFIDLTDHLAPLAVKELAARMAQDIAIIISTAPDEQPTATLTEYELDAVILRPKSRHASVAFATPDRGDDTGYAEAHLIVLDGTPGWLVLLSHNPHFHAYLTTDSTTAARAIVDFTNTHIDAWLEDR